jgi:RNA polymerase sigma-70 factor (ECF subfamily)
LQVILERYLRSWEGADVDAFAAVLKEDAVLTMPPWPQWYRGRDAISAFFSWTIRPGGRGPFRLVPTAANGQRAFAFYSRRQGTEWRSHSIQLLSIQGESIAAMTSFLLPTLFPAFGLPEALSS